MIDKRVNLAVVTSNECVTEYKERRSTEIKQYKTLHFHDSLGFLKKLSFFLSWFSLIEHKFP